MFLDVVFGDMNNLSLFSERYQSQPAGQEAYMYKYNESDQWPLLLT